MREFFIYLAGAMSDIDFVESNEWRKTLTEMFKHTYSDIKVKCINPNDYYNFKEVTYDSEHEVMEFDLYKVRHSDMVIVDFNHPDSKGTLVEQAIAYENKIPIIGLNEKNNKLHPWQIDMSNKIFDDKLKLVNYVTNFYLN